MKCFIYLFITFNLCISLSAQIEKSELTSTRVEILCPSHLEFEFPQNVLNKFSVEFGGYPIAIFKEAKIENDKLVAIYNYVLASYNDFGLSCDESSIDDLPNSIELQLKYSDTFYSDWQLQEKIQIDRSDKGFLVNPAVIPVDQINVKTKPTGWYGGTYSNSTQNNKQPKLFMEFEGHASINEDGTGFYVANSISELGGNQGGILAAPDVTKPNQKIDKPIKKPMGKKAIGKKKPGANNKPDMKKKTLKKKP